MTNPEINKRIAKLLGVNIWAESQDWITVVNATKDWFIKFNPCEDWNQLMPLTVERGISLERCNDGWFSYSDRHSVCRSNENPQFALCMCLIKVLEAESMELDK